MTTSAKTIRWLRSLGYRAASVEQFVRVNQTQFRRDLFGFADIIAFRPPDKIVLIQTTTRSNMASRRRKIISSIHAHDWAWSGGEIWLVVWDTVSKAEIAPRNVEYFTRTKLRAKKHA